MTQAVPDADRRRSATMQAWAVVLFMGVATVLLIVFLAFTTHRTPESVNGRTATTSGDLGPNGGR